MQQGAAPQVSVGIPVYNGENYVAHAIESVLTQTFRDFELIICDNASTDRTEKICRRYAAQDSRVRYVRNERNLGAAPNFNRCFHLSTGEYFKWQASDDALEPTFLERCVALLDANADAVLCQSHVAIIDENGETLEIYEGDLPGIGSPRISDRFGAAILPHKVMDFFGLMRRPVLAGTLLHADFPGADRVLVAQLALRGRFLRIAEPLFLNRNHPDRYQRAICLAERATWHNSSSTNPVVVPSLTVYRWYIREMRRQVDEPAERLRCYGHLLRWWTQKMVLKRLFWDLLAALVGPRGSDEIHMRYNRLKERLLPHLGGKVF
ncbi:MAG: glycosyltransferase family 2 protein [Geminicoccales bacterium]